MFGVCGRKKAYMVTYMPILGFTWLCATFNAFMST